MTLPIRITSNTTVGNVNGEWPYGAAREVLVGEVFTFATVGGFAPGNATMLAEPSGGALTINNTNKTLTFTQPGVYRFTVDSAAGVTERQVVAFETTVPALVPATSPNAGGGAVSVDQRRRIILRNLANEVTSPLGSSAHAAAKAGTFAAMQGKVNWAAFGGD